MYNYSSQHTLIMSTYTQLTDSGPNDTLYIQNRIEGDLIIKRLSDLEYPGFGTLALFTISNRPLLDSETSYEVFINTETDTHGHLPGVPSLITFPGVTQRVIAPHM